MHFPKLETCKTEHPSYAKQLGALAGVLERQLEQRTIAELSAKTLAKQLQTNRTRALTLLSLARDCGALEAKYLVRCRTTFTVLGAYDSLSQIPEALECPVEETEHDSSEYFVDLVFRTTREAAVD